MRRGQNPNLIIDDYGVFLGVNLSWDHVAEHECGNKRIRKIFGMPDELTRDNAGFDYRKVTIFPENRIIFHESEKSDRAYIAFNKISHIFSKDEDEFFNQTELSFYKKGISAVWSGDGFIIAVQGRDNIDYLRNLWENGFKKKDIVIYLAGDRGPFSNAGLVIAFYSRLSKEDSDMVKESDLDKIRLREASEETGIVQKIDEINECYREGAKFPYDEPVGYFALSPRWVHENEKNKTKYNVIYWLNPQRQKYTNFGWFTVEELEQWIKGEGPIPK